MPARALLLLPALLLVTPAFADNWPQFRGPGGRGHAAAVGLPVTWSETQNVVWKTPLHDKGWSSPVVWGDQVWLTTARADGKEFFALCVDRNTGKIVHDIKLLDVAEPAFCHAYNSYASPTPAIEEGRVYIHFGTYGTFCLDTATGKTLWEQRDLHCDHFRGPGSSPVIWQNLLFLTFDGFDVQYVAALDKHTGRIVWRKDRDINYGTTNGDFKKAYSTPTIAVVAGKPELVSPAATATTAYDPATGDEIWRVYHGGMNVAAPPQFDGRHLFLCTGDCGKRLLALRPDGHGDVTNTHIDWTSNKGVPTRVAPLLIDHGLYLVSEAGVLSCLDPDTGAVRWQERLRGKYCSSPVYADGKLYVFDEEGRGVVGRVGDKWIPLAVNQLDAGCMATPAVAGPALFVRTRTHLYRIEQKK